MAAGELIMARAPIDHEEAISRPEEDRAGNGREDPPVMSSPVDGSCGLVL